MLGKLTWVRYGLVLFAGLTGFACSQETQEPAQIGAAQVELRSDLVLPETPDVSTTLLPEESTDYSGLSVDPIQATLRISLPGLKNDSHDRAYGAINRYEFLPALLKDPSTRNSSPKKSTADTDTWTLADKYWVRAGNGFGVAGERMNPSGTVQLDDASFYFPTVTLNPYFKASEHLKPMAEPFKSQKPLIFHSGATGFAQEPPVDAAPSEHLPAFETRLELSPIPETQVYFSSLPKTKVILTPAEHRLDLMNGNENLNRNRFDKLR